MPSPQRSLWGVVELIGRAKAAGRLREDFDSSDLVLLHMANAGVVNVWRRVVALFIQSFEAPARVTLPASPEHDALYRAMPRAVNSPHQYVLVLQKECKSKDGLIPA
jgi:hypothetical protein